MLKTVILNNRTIPVPVPINNLEEALYWIQDTFSDEESAITKVVLDGRNIDEYELKLKDIKKIELKPTSKLCVQLDSPLDLAIQSIEAIKNLLLIIQQHLRVIAVELWQLHSNKAPSLLRNNLEDIQLVSDLLLHVEALILRPGFELTSFKKLTQQMQQIYLSLQKLYLESNWKEYAKSLLNKVEPLCNTLNFHLDDIKEQILQNINFKHYNSSFC